MSLTITTETSEPITLAEGQLLQLTAIGTFTDGTIEELTDQVSWQSSSSAASIDARGLVTAETTTDAVTLSASLSGLSADISLAIVANSLVSLALTLDQQSLPQGGTSVYQVLGIYLNGDTEDLTARAGLSLTTDNVTALVLGRLQGQSAGTSIVQASYQSIMSNDVTVTVTDVTLEQLGLYTDSAITLPFYGSQVLRAYALFSDDSFEWVSEYADWISSDSGITVDNGIVQVISSGSAQITASYFGLTSDAVSVSSSALALERLDLVLAEGEGLPLTIGASAQLLALGSYTDGSQLDVTDVVDWQSSDNSTLNVENGLVTGLAAGDAEISATLSTQTASRTIEVDAATLQAIEILPSSVSGLAVGYSTDVQAFGSYSDGTVVDLTSTATWQSSDPTIATVDRGKIKGQSAGNSQVWAIFDDLNSNGIDVVVSAATLTQIQLITPVTQLPVGIETLWQAEASFSNGSSSDVTSDVTWISSDPSVALVLDGVLFAISEGTAKISASLDDISSSSVTITVDSATLQSLQISGVSGLVLSQLPLGASADIEALGFYSDGSSVDLSSQVSWLSSPTAALVVAQQQVTANAIGDATLTASLDDVSSNRLALTITEASLTALQVTTADGEDTVTLANGGNTQLTALGFYSDGSSIDLSDNIQWFSSDTNVVIVKEGQLFANGEGSAIISSSGGDINGNTVDVTVIPASLTGLQINSDDLQLAAGQSSQLTVTASYLDGSSIEFTESALWESSDSSVATVINGQVTVLKAGTSTISVALEESFLSELGQVSTQAVLRDEITLTATDATITDLQISSNNSGLIISLPVGSGAQLQAFGYYSDGTVAQLTQQVNWQSSELSVALVIGGFVQATGTGTATISASLDDEITESVTVTTTSASLNAITLTPSAITLAAGRSEQLTAIGTYSDNRNVDLTEEVIWQSSDTGVTSVQAGRVLAYQTGTSEISASLAGVSSSSTEVTVGAASLDSIQLTASDGRDELTLASGLRTTLTALGQYSDGSSTPLLSASWRSSDPTVAIVSNGTVIALTAGVADITAESEGISTDSVQVTVTSASLSSIEISALSREDLPVGSQRDLVATGFYSDGSSLDLTTQVAWQSAELTIASVLAGQVTAIGSGTTTITATFGSVSASFDITISEAVLSSIQLTDRQGDTEITVARGVQVPLLAIGLYSDGSSRELATAAWLSSDSSAVVVVNGIVIGVGQSGSAANISATLDGISSNDVVVTVSDATLTAIQVSSDANTSIPVGFSRQYQATGFYSDGSTIDLTELVSWQSDRIAVATVAAGLATGISSGTTQITAYLDDVTSAEVNLIISSASLTELQLAALDYDALDALPVGQTRQLQITGFYSDSSNATLNSSNSVSWQSSDPSVALVIEGVLIARATGETEISATVGELSSNALTVTVTDATLSQLQASADPSTIPVGASTQLQAIGTYSDSSALDLSQTVSWQVSDPTLATVIGNELLAIASGSVTVTAELSGVQSDELSITLAEASLEGIRLVAEASSTLATGQQLFLRALGDYSDGTQLDVSELVAWQSSEPSVATITTAVTEAGIQGVVLGLSTGSAEIQASLAGITATVTVTVSQAVIDELQVQNLGASSLPVGGRSLLQSVANYSDGRSQNVTANVVWRSSEPSIAIVLDGVIFALSEGATELSAELDGTASNKVSLTVSGATLSRLQLSSPDGTSLPLGQVGRLLVEGFYSDGSTLDVTELVSWQTSDSAVLTVTNGDIRTLTSGSAEVTASLDSINSNSQTITVSSASLSGLQISTATGNSSVTLAKGTSTTLTALGFYSDGNVLTETDSVAWRSSDVTIAQVIDGTVLALAEGSVTIQAIDGSQSSNTVAVTVQSASLSQLQVDATDFSLASGLEQQLTATGIFSDGSSLNLTEAVQWQSSDPSVATIIDGRVAAISSGSTTISVSYDSSDEALVSSSATISSESITLTVTSATLTELQLSNDELGLANALPIGQGLQLQATAYYSDGSSAQVTSQANWQTSDVNVALVLSGFVQATGSGTATISASLDGISSDSVSITTSSAVLSQLLLSPSSLSLAQGTTSSITATGIYSDNSSGDLTAQVNWQSSDSSVATVIAGNVTAANSGTAEISAYLDDVSSANLVVTVGSATISSLQLSSSLGEPELTLPVGLTSQLVATATYSDNTTRTLADLDWSSSANNVAIVVDGFVIALSTGTTEIRASADGLRSEEYRITVTDAALTQIQVASTEQDEFSALPAGISRTYSALGYYSNGLVEEMTDAVSWQSSDLAVATVFNGTVTGVSSGSSDITAYFDEITSNSATVTVSEPVLTELQLSPAEPLLVNQLPVGLTLEMVVTAVYSDETSAIVTDAVVWFSDDASVAATLDGVLTGYSEGSAAISASFVDSDGTTTISNAVTVTVTAATLTEIQISGDGTTFVPLGTTTELLAMGYYSDGSTADITDIVDWISSDSGVISVQSGVVAAVARGNRSTVTASLDGITSNSQFYTVVSAILTGLRIESPTGIPVSLPINTRQQLTAIAEYSDESELIVTVSTSWQSSNIPVAAVVSGLIVAKVAGEVTITATYGSVQTEVAVTVESAPLTSVNTWVLSDPSVATIFEGRVYGIAAGSSTLSALYEGISSNSRTITVTTGTVERIQVEPSPELTSGFVDIGSSIQLLAYAYYSNGSVVEITDSATWFSDDPSVATVAKGAVVGVSAGLFIGVRASE
ncbi:MAG: Ig-like domain-containing protein [Ferrimonas sp.]